MMELEQVRACDTINDISEDMLDLVSKDDAVNAVRHLVVKNDALRNEIRGLKGEVVLVVGKALNTILELMKLCEPQDIVDEENVKP